MVEMEIWVEQTIDNNSYQPVLQPELEWRGTEACPDTLLIRCTNLWVER